MDQSRPTDQLVDRATEVLHDAIVTGRLRPGERLVQQQLADELGISRTPLREALRRLEQEGLVVVVNRGLAVADPEPEALLDIYNLREVLDGLAARLAAARMSNEELDELEALHRRGDGLDRGIDPDGWRKLNADFHNFILRCAQSPALSRVMPAGRISRHLRYPSAFLHPARIQAGHADHEAILAALRARDGTAAEAAARSHMRRVQAALREDIERAAQTSAAPRLRPLRAAGHTPGQRDETRPPVRSSG
jgi:DNA-binding GntR family transcriptional regulator